jgi:hypothetical protein
MNSVPILFKVTSGISESSIGFLISDLLTRRSWRRQTAPEARRINEELEGSENRCCTTGLLQPTKPVSSRILGRRRVSGAVREHCGLQSAVSGVPGLHVWLGTYVWLSGFCRKRPPICRYWEWPHRYRFGPHHGANSGHFFHLQHPSYHVFCIKFWQNATN